MSRTSRGASYGGEALCVTRSERARVQRHPGIFSSAFSWHFHRPPPVLASQSTGFRHGDSRNTNESIFGGRSGHCRSGKSSGSHDLAREATRDASRVHPGSQPGACSSTGCGGACYVHTRCSVHGMKGGSSAHPGVEWHVDPRTEGSPVAHIGLHEIPRRSDGVARKEGCTA